MFRQGKENILSFLYSALFNNAFAALNLLEKYVLAILQPDNGIRLKYKCFIPAATQGACS
jgi:hypothetical protein